MRKYHLTHKKVYLNQALVYAESVEAQNNLPHVLPAFRMKTKSHLSCIAFNYICKKKWLAHFAPSDEIECFHLACRNTVHTLLKIRTFPFPIKEIGNMRPKFHSEAREDFWCKCKHPKQQGKGIGVKVCKSRSGWEEMKLRQQDKWWDNRLTSVKED